MNKMIPIETNALVLQQQQQQQQQSQRPKQTSHPNERSSRDNNRQKSRRTGCSRSNDRESSSSSSDNDRDDGNESLDDDDDASLSDRSSRGSSPNKPPDRIQWDYRMNLIGKRIKESKAFCCLNCQYPVLLSGRLMPCKHAAFCLQCANDFKSSRRSCPKCNEAITDVEKIEAKNLIFCHHVSHPSSQDACLRGYTSQRDLQAHVKRRHEQPPPIQLPPPSAQVRLDSPHQLHPPTHSPSAAFPGLVVDGQQQTPPSQIPPPLMTFPPMNVPNMAPPPLFDMGYRPPNYGLPPPPQQQQFMPSQPQYRPPPYQTNRPYY